MLELELEDAPAGARSLRRGPVADWLRDLRLLGMRPTVMLVDNAASPEAAAWRSPIVVFVAALAVIATERVDRTKVALAGARCSCCSRRRSSRSRRSRRSTGTRSGCWSG